jgi:hypothetical protein
MVLGDPGLFQKIPDITALLPQGGCDGEQAAAAEGAIGGLHAPAVAWQTSDLALNHCWPESTLRGVVGGLDSWVFQEGPERLLVLEQLLAGVSGAIEN